METRSRSHVHVYQFNPEWKTFYTKSFDEKLDKIMQAILEFQGHFLANSEVHDQCMIVLPEGILNPEYDFYKGACNESQKGHFEKKLQELQSNLSDRTLVIPGAIVWLRDDGGYQVTTYFVTQTQMKQYDKKHSSGDLTINDASVPMVAGTDSGIFKFNGMTIGLEICRDHEEQSLKCALGKNKYVDIHVLIANGQNVNTSHIATRPNQSLFVVSELEPEKEIYLGFMYKRYEASVCYQVEPVQQSQQSVPGSRGRTQVVGKILSAQNKMAIVPINVEKTSNNLFYACWNAPRIIKETSFDRQPSCLSHLGDEKESKIILAAPITAENGNKQAIAVLENYLAVRGKESNHFSLFSHGKDDKISAAEKLIEHVKGNTVLFTKEEADCLKDGRLGLLVSAHFPIMQGISVANPVSYINPEVWMNHR